METKTNNKIAYSRNEKILRIITIFGIVLSIAVGILLFPLGKARGGIIILCACAVSIFLISSFCTRRVKNYFSLHKYRKVFLACFYSIIMIIAMLTATLVSIFTTYTFDELSADAINYAQENIFDKGGRIENMESTIFDHFEYENGHYFSIETDFDIVDSKGNSTDYSVNTYIKINRYSGEIAVIDSLQYEIAKAYK